MSWVDKEGEEWEELVNCEELDDEVIKKIERRKWALSFVIFGSAFTMAGAILLLLFDDEIMAFLGSCMIYIGFIALIKGVSFELQKDNNYYNKCIKLCIIW